jgi:hypothetical protein
MTKFAPAKCFRGAAFLALLVLALSAGMAAAEDGTPPAPPPAAAAPGLPPQPPPVDKPGFLHQLKVWWDDSLGFFGKGLEKSGDVTKGAAGAAGDVVKGAVEGTKNAATAIVKLPNTRMIDVREHCDKAPNGAPDCETAAAKGCRGKGFGGGHPLDVRTEKKCDLTALQSGQIPSERDCSVETTVTRAVCQ